MPDYRIEIELAEPLFCGSKYAISNEMTSLEFIPGTALRGSLASELAYSGRAGEIPKWFAPTGPRWTPALPSPGPGLTKQVGDPSAFIVPMPLSFLRAKEDGNPFRGQFPVLNSLYPEQAPEDQGEQRTRIAQKWLVVSGGEPLFPYSPARATSMHVGLHYGRQSNRNEALFSRRAVAADNRFTAWVEDPAGVLRDAFPASAVIGKRASAGNGRVSLLWTGGRFPWAGQGGTEEGEATVQVISDAIIPDGEGRYLAGLGKAQWERILGQQVEVVSAASATRNIRNWSNAWGLPREHRLAITGGSVFRLRSEGGGGPEWKAALDGLARNGLGELRHEGFGWVSVNPAWLAKTIIAPRPEDEKEKAERRKRDPQPARWPGLEDFDPERLLDTLNKAKKAETEISKMQAGAARKIGELGAYAARVREQADVIKYLQGMAGRTNPRAWKGVCNAILGDLQDLASVELVRFYLDGIETLHG